MRKNSIFYILLGLILFVSQITYGLITVEFLTATHGSSIIKTALANALRDPIFVLYGAWYLIVGTLIHTALLAFPSFAVRKASQLHTKKQNIIFWKVIISISFLLILSLLNEAIFPNSNATPLQNKAISNTTIIVSSSFFFALFLFFCAKIQRESLKYFFISIFIALLLFFSTLPYSYSNEAQKPIQKNIILIGIDSLRPDHLHLLNDSAAPPTNALMPKLENWLSDSIVFRDAVTPMARTFPALMSLLTAKYPLNNGIRGNLFPKENMRFNWTLGTHLQKLGYTTAFSTDDTRFANIESEYGFDVISTPPQGLIDFFYGNLLDTVGTNLLGLFPASRWLLPATYGNRAASGSYHPSQFTSKLDGLIDRLPSTSTFLMTHFCVAHWPYINEGILSSSKRYNSFDSYLPYERALRAADRQFSFLIEKLENSGMLTDAIVVVYSDHGEELGIEKDLKFRHHKKLPRTRRGHGTSIFSPSQNRILLAFKVFEGGKEIQEKKVSYVPALLTDVAPTVIERIGSNLPNDLDGIDLFSPPSNIENRVRFLEGAYTLPAINSDGEVDSAETLKRFGNRFHVTDDLKIRFKASNAAPMMKQWGFIKRNKVTGFKRRGIRKSSLSSKRKGWRSVEWPSPKKNRGQTHF
ncbi:sulfatase-like hydrolase/transferase [Salinisphaera orenii]|uniref:sulfatase-like hydrolase/transferase n=1 Tax=Salinisphaera orenii TaxID=856731 RepID=UPI000F4911A0|nr:sulfatase-like hydrolase/transferase [Salinisphaera halophila]